MKSRNGPHKAPFIGELAAKGGLRGLKVGPYECPDWGYFCGLLTATSELRLFPA